MIEPEPRQFLPVIGIQTALNYFGFSLGPVDNVPGRGTGGAIKRYQDVMGYPVGSGSLRQIWRVCGWPLFRKLVN